MSALPGPAPLVFYVHDELALDSWIGYAPDAAIKDMSSIGSPGALPSTRPTPPQRGSFPLDHDGECKKAMASYLLCMKKVRGVNEDECRSLAKAYLACRMDRNLMARDDFKNLGFAEPRQPTKDAEPEKGVKGELRWPLLKATARPPPTPSNKSRRSRTIACLALQDRPFASLTTFGARMRQSAEVTPRKATPPSPSYMTNDEFASYLAGLRNNRVARPGGARAQPPSSRPFAGRTNTGRYSLDASSQDTVIPATTVPGHQRTQSQTPSIAAGSISSRLSTISARSRDYYPTKPTVPLKPSEIVPTANYMERGQRWMEKEEAYSLRDAMEEMDLRDNKKDAPEDEEETRIYNAALDEAAELVWRHEHGVRPRPPDGPYRYRPHLRKDSYAHARTAVVGRGEGDAGSSDQSRNSISGFNSPSGTSSDEDDMSRRNQSSAEANHPDEQQQTTGKMKSYGSVGGRFAGGRRSSMKRNISGEVERPFSGDQIWEEPDAPSSKEAITVTPHRGPRPLVSLGPKPSNSIGRVPHEPAREEPGGPSKPLERVEIHRNPPTRSRNAQYQVNTPLAPKQIPEGQHKNGVEIRSDDIRTATSMKLKDRSPNLPEPTAVSDSPGRPIVSFDANWKAPEESTDVSPDRPDPTASQPVEIPAIVVAEESTPQSRAPTSSSVPSISVAAPDEPRRGSIPTINVPSIAVDEAPGRRRVPDIVIPGDSPTKKSTRPLPMPGARGVQGRDWQRPRGHWSPAPGALGRAATLCHECSLPIEGKFVALAGSPERFHPGCFSCFSCGTSLEAMEISPEPEASRDARLERIWRRAAGEVLEETPGKTMAEDGDERLRFFCHLDWHELYAPRCKHCKTPILGEHIVALGEHWHYGHFFCAECGDPFEHGMTHIEKDGYAWCINCQTRRTERRAPKCKMCKTAVIGQYIKALGGEWHEHCFRCAECKGSFDDGQIFPKEVDGGAIVLCTKCRAKELKF